MARDHPFADPGGGKFGMVFGLFRKKDDDDGRKASGRHETAMPAPADIAPVDEAPVENDPVAQLHATPEWKKLEEYIDKNPAFQFTSFDGLYWIDPFLGTQVSAPFDLRGTIITYFTENDHWRTGKLKSPVQLRQLIWNGYLEDNLITDTRFHKFDQHGHWINPWTQKSSPSITTALAEKPEYFQKRVAAEMSQIADANISDMLSLEDLEVELGIREKKEEEPEENRRKSGITGIDGKGGITGGTSRVDHQAVPQQPAGSGQYPAQGPAGSGQYPAQPAGSGQYPAQGPAGSGAYPVQAAPGSGAYPVQGQPPSGSYPVVDGGPEAQDQPSSGVFPATGFIPQTATIANAVPPPPAGEQPLDDNGQPISSPFQVQLVNAPGGVPSVPSGQAVYTDLTQLHQLVSQQTGTIVRGGVADALPIISLRGTDEPVIEDDVGEPGSGVFIPSTVPIVRQSEVSDDVVRELVHSLKKISLAAGSLTIRPEDLMAKPPEEEKVDTDLEPLMPTDSTNYMDGDDEGLEPDPEGGTKSTTGRKKAVDDDEDYEQDMNKAQKVQNHLLGGIPALDGVEVAIEYIPYSHIGGDFYNIIKIDDRRFFFIVGDVSGHGVQAALIVSSIVNTLKIIFKTRESSLEYDLLDIICELNDYLRECLMTGQFFTCFAGIFTAGKPAVLESVCCGHHPTICLNPADQDGLKEIGSSGMGIGLVGSKTLRKQTTVDRTELSAGDTLCIYTDGILEVMDENGEELGETLVRCSFFAHINNPLQEIISAVLKDIADESDGVIADDQTVMILRVKDPPMGVLKRWQEQDQGLFGAAADPEPASGPEPVVISKPSSPPSVAQDPPSSVPGLDDLLEGLDDGGDEGFKL